MLTAYAALRLPCICAHTHPLARALPCATLAGECAIQTDWELCKRLWLAGYQVAYMELNRAGLQDSSGNPSGTHTPTSEHRCWGRQNRLSGGLSNERCTTVHNSMSSNQTAELAAPCTWHPAATCISPRRHQLPAVPVAMERVFIAHVLTCLGACLCAARRHGDGRHPTGVQWAAHIRRLNLGKLELIDPGKCPYIRDSCNMTR